MRKFVSWLENNLGLVVIIGVVLTFTLPSILSLPAFYSFLELAKGNDVGSAIGGITAPVIGFSHVW